MALFFRDTGKRSSICRGHELEACRHLHDPVTVRHPHVEQAKAFLGDLVFDVFQQGSMSVRTYLGIEVLDSLARNIFAIFSISEKFFLKK